MLNPGELQIQGRLVTKNILFINWLQILIIMEQLLIESVLLTFVGGMIGILIGGALTALPWLAIINFTTVAWTFSLPLSSILLAVGVSTVTGVVFGIYPARQAAIKNPIDSLRYE